MTNRDTQKLHTELQTIDDSVTISYALFNQAGHYLERAAMHIGELRALIEPPSENSSHSNLGNYNSLTSQESDEQDDKPVRKSDDPFHRSDITQPEPQAMKNDDDNASAQDFRNTRNMSHATGSASLPSPICDNDLAMGAHHSIKRGNVVGEGSN